MQIKVMIRGDMPNSFAKKNGERVNERVLTCLDMSDGHAQLPDTFEALDKEVPSNAPSMAGRMALLTVSEMVPRQSGVRLVGRIELLPVK